MMMINHGAFKMEQPTFLAMELVYISYDKQKLIVLLKAITLCFWSLQIPRKFLPGHDGCFQTYLMQEIQKYDLNWNLTSPFWGQSNIAQKSAAERAELAVLVG